MYNPHSSPRNDVPKGTQSKWQSQCQCLYNTLFHQCLTATMAAAITGIPQKNICRIKRYYEKEGLLWIVRIAPCAETGFKAQWLTTNPDRKPATVHPVNTGSHE